MTKHSILIVDDIQANLQFLHSTLIKQGYQVYSAINGKMALKVAQKKLPDLILLDIMMQGMNGYEVCEHLKADEQTRDIPVIFLSALNETFDKMKAFSVGGVDYVTKPFQVKELLARVATHLALRHLQKKLVAQNVQLQEEITEHQQTEKILQKTLKNLRSTQSQLIQSEKLAALGQLIAGIAHEINTPLGAIRASIDNLLDSFNDAIMTLPQLSQSIVENDNHLKLLITLLKKSKDSSTYLTSKEKRILKRTVQQKLSNENIAEVSTLANMLTYMKIFDVCEECDELWPLLKDEQAISIVKAARNFVSVRKNSENINLAVDKASKVIFALRKFAHQDASGEKTEIDIIDSIETVLTLYHNQIKQGVEVVKHYQSLPPVLCYADEIHQVWTNIIHNALHAMALNGTLTIEVTRSAENQIRVSFTDTGCGISSAIKARIFEPFFTTKRRGEGSGIGLDIVKKIIDKHQGKIEIESEVGKGTTFKVFLNNYRGSEK
ncbi:MAG: hybrid sensor histidine kinase/response regulator [Candidatus Parabeggiatoa sp. nov. 3]|nr:MAG: hybrid sensor histidine kinase/response regulator [Gammaproteobacteria bacterium]RKZ61320.1 MAG: hybrid sensor histidine kinase/response regulator [Gammaproteobacteria bacterium]